MPNPILFLSEIYRVLKPSGKLLLAIPDKRYTFDRNRQLTPLGNLEKKFLENVTYVSDEEIEEFVHKTSNEVIPSIPEEKKKFLEVRRQRSIHVHVWDSKTFCQFMKFFALRHWPFRLLKAILPEQVPQKEILMLLKRER